MNTRRINSLLKVGLALGLAASTTSVWAGDGIIANGRQALARIQAEATAPPSAFERVQQIRQSLQGARVIPGLDALRARGYAALENIQTQLKQDLLHRPLVLLHPGVQMTRAVSHADSGHGPDNWALPSFEIKPLIDPTLLFFSFGR